MKYSGVVGFWIGEKETTPGVWRGEIIERPYTGEVIKKNLRWQARSESLTDDLTVSNRISILADIYMLDNWPSVRYVVWNGVKWRVTNVDVSYPRITLDIGEVYNG